jgi:hypothetical protein
MTNALSIVRSLIIYSLCLPLAIYVGYLLAVPWNQVNFTILVIAVSLPLIPILLRWHHLFLIASWNVSMVLFFLPGRPTLWIVLTAVSLVFSVLHHILHRDRRLIQVPSLTRPLIFLAIVVLITAKLTGGFGMRVTGGDTMGGKRYILLLMAIAGYFAITFEQPSEGRRIAYFSVYILGSLVGIIGSLGRYVGQDFYFLFTLFPVEDVYALGASGNLGDLSVRLSGLAFACCSVIYFVLARHGVRGLFNLSERWHFLPFRFRGGLAINHPWRMLIFVFMIWTSLLGGYRSLAIGLALTFTIQFYLERMYRTAVLPIVLLGSIMVAAICIPMVNKMPLTIQRSLSFLPLDVDPIARYSAEASSEWRKNMWRNVVPTIPQYLILGKGYAISSADLEMQSGAFARSGDPAEGAMLAGDYHNGPLSVIVPLGIFGALGFLWFLWASFRVFLSNYRYGSAEMKLVNTLMLSLFLSRIISFFFVFGSLYSEMAAFTGLVALNVCLNGGVKGREPAPAPALRSNLDQFKLARAAKH